MATRRLSIGLPVFNGERYLESALDSLLAQTYSDFELIIVDNASTDRSPEIARAYAAKDSRLRYYRNEKNIGTAGNWYRAFELSSAEYFKWAADDDLYEPEFIARCFKALDDNPSAIACYTSAKIIDAEGNFVRDLEVQIDTASAKPHVRLYNAIGIDYLCVQMYSVMRSSALRRVARYEGYYGWDRNALAEICLLGPVLELPERLFLHRLHPNSGGSVLHVGRPLSDLEEMDPGVNWKLELSGLNASALTRFGNYFRAIERAPFSRLEKLRCHEEIVRLVAEKSLTRIKRLRSARH